LFLNGQTPLTINRKLQHSKLQVDTMKRCNDIVCDCTLASRWYFVLLYLWSALGQYSRNFGKLASLLTSMSVIICILFCPAVGDWAGNDHRTDNQQSSQAALQNVHIYCTERSWHRLTWSHA